MPKESDRTVEYLKQLSYYDLNLELVRCKNLVKERTELLERANKYLSRVIDECNRRGN